MTDDFVYGVGYQSSLFLCLPTTINDFRYSLRALWVFPPRLRGVPMQRWAWDL